MKKRIFLIAAVIASLFIIFAGIASLSFVWGASFLGFILIFQITMNNKKSLKWNKRDKFDLDAKNFIKEKLSNIIFNFSKVAAILSAVILVLINLPELNALPFAFFIAVSIGLSIAMLTSIPKWLKSYQIVRAIMSLIVIISLIVMAYLTFGTVYVWLPVVFSLISIYFFNSFSELEEILGCKNLTGSILLSLLIFVASVSGFIQLRRNGLGDMEVNIFSGNAKEFIGNKLAEQPLLFLIIFLVIIFVGFIFIKKNKQNKMQAKIEADRLRSKEQEEIEREKNNQESLQRIADIAHHAQDLSIADVYFLATALKYFGGYEKFSVHYLTSVELKSFLTISQIKKQIVWDEKLEKVFELYNDLFARTFKDEDLNLLISRLGNFDQYLSAFSNFSGYNTLKRAITTRMPLIEDALRNAK